MRGKRFLTGAVSPGGRDEKHGTHVQHVDGPKGRLGAEWRVAGVRFPGRDQGRPGALRGPSQATPPPPSAPLPVAGTTDGVAGWQD